MSDTIDQQCIDTLRFLSVDMVEAADSGHPGLPLDAAPMAYTLWANYLKHSPKNPLWPDRDRFVLSAGHGSALLYSLLYATGYDLSLDDIKSFRQWGSKAPGHPERGHTAGVEVTTAYDGTAVTTRHAAIQVDAIDTTGAGDAFCGALAARLAAGDSMDDAIGWAIRAGGLATTRRGAVPSLPTSDEIVARLSAEA